MHATATKAKATRQSTQVVTPAATTTDMISPRKIPLWSQKALPLQTKLTVNMPGDRYEQEANRVAEQVMRMSAPRVQRKSCACGGSLGSDSMCTECKRKQLGIQRIASQDSPQMAAPPLVHQVLQEPGRPLDGATRNFMEARFGQDFGHVRIHTDGKAAAAAESVSAKAYTVGTNVVFNAGQYAPQTGGGAMLLAHELVHVLQQKDAPQPSVARVPDRDDIGEGRYSYSNNCGWIDWAHASPSLATELIDRVRHASNALRAAGSSATPETGDLASPTMRSAPGGIVLSSATVHVRLVRPLSGDEVLGVALSIFKELSIVFEMQQRWTELLGRSSFSQEDLPSNLIGFYRAARGYSRSEINQYCDALDVAGSEAEYDRNHNFRQNHTFFPVGISGHWPSELANIDHSQSRDLYEIRTMTATQGSDGYQFCPVYRIEGTVGEVDLLIFSVGGAHFSRADNVRVTPTYRAYSGTHGAYGHVTFIEVEPYSSSDAGILAAHDILWPIYLPAPVLVCLSSHGNPV